MERGLIELSVKYGGLRIMNPPDRRYQKSQKSTQEEMEIIKKQQVIYHIDPAELKTMENYTQCKSNEAI